MIIEDDTAAIIVLSKINYYRFTAYGLTFKITGSDNYIDGTSFNRILSIYQFDNKLRSLILSYLTDIEIAFKTHIAYHHAHEYSPIGYKDENTFGFKKSHKKFIESIDRYLFDNKNELFVQHHHQTYNGIFPIWVIVEILTFSATSKLFKNLKKQDKSYISKKYYNLSYKLLESWLHSLSNLRNLCAHHSRLYGKNLTIAPSIRGFPNTQHQIASHSLFATMMVLIRILDSNNKSNFITNLAALLEQYKDEVELSQIGFPTNWESYLMKI